MSILKPKAKEKTRTFSVRLPAELTDQIDAIRDDAERAGLIFDSAEIVGRALAAAIKGARSELDALCTQSVNTAPTSPAPLVRDGVGRDAGGASQRRDEPQPDGAAA